MGKPLPVDNLAFILSCDIDIVLATKRDIMEAVSRAFGSR